MHCAPLLRIWLILFTYAQNCVSTNNDRACKGCDRPDKAHSRLSIIIAVYNSLGLNQTIADRTTHVAESEKIKGPASYFPSIEKTYGKPVTHWLKLLDSLQDRKHMEQVAYLKSEHQIGHGHANALVAYHRAQLET